MLSLAFCQISNEQQQKLRRSVYCKRTGFGSYCIPTFIWDTVGIYWDSFRMIKQSPPSISNLAMRLIILASRFWRHRNGTAGISCLSRERSFTSLTKSGTAPLGGSDPFFSCLVKKLLFYAALDFGEVSRISRLDPFLDLSWDNNGEVIIFLTIDPRFFQSKDTNHGTMVISVQLSVSDSQVWRRYPHVPWLET